MTKVKIDQSLCKGCYICLEMCPRRVFEKTDTIHKKGFQSLKVFSERCKPCYICERFCPGAITIGKPSKVKAFKQESKVEKRGDWQFSKSLLKPGRYFMSGNEACVVGALTAGCQFYAGYPITPAREILEGMAQKMRGVKGTFIQMEDEIAALAAVIGASWTGVKAMTATSGPGFSLMQENVSYADMTETPCVIIDVQRAGPSTGQSTRPAAGDIREARWGPHGGSQHIALYPSSVQECYDLMIKAFSLSEQFRTPVIFLSDAFLAHLKEPLTTKEKVKAFNRIYIPGKPAFGPTEDFSAPSMPCFGDGELLTITGSTHNQWGNRKVNDPHVQESLDMHLQNKILQEKPIDVEELFLEDAEIIIVTYGSVVRAAKWAIKEARKRGLRVGLFRPRILWPFPSERIREISKKGQRFLVPEMNQGQLNYVVREKISNEVISLPQPNGEMIDPRRILRYLIEGRW